MDIQFRYERRLNQSVDVHTLDEIIEIHQEDVHSKGVNQSDVDSWIADKITLLYNDNLLYTGVDNFSIAEGVIIENINSGSGNDTIMDNEVDNLISSGAGDDAIFIGNGGFDHIDGGDGIDTLYLNRNRDDIELSRLDEERYIIALTIQ